jgi:NTP pyrophosphatase (non-canonical NTP hydrolase)
MTVEHDPCAATEEQIFEGKAAPITFDGYQEQASTTAVYPGQGTFQGLAYAALGLNGEAGETAEQIKKIWRDEGTQDLSEAMRRVLDDIQLKLRQGMTSYTDIMSKAHGDAHAIFHTPLSDERRQKLLKELGDTLWYAAQIATELDVSLGDVAQGNLDKLAARREANLIHGEGSDR